MAAIDRSNTQSVAIVIPAYNEALAIGNVLERCLAAGFSVTVVDDGSGDETAAVVGQHRVELLRHAENRGKGAALLTGVSHALADGAKHIVTLDGDGQHRPEDIVRMVDMAERSPGSIVVGSRRADHGNAPRSRYIANRIADFCISWAGGQRLEDTQSGFRLYPAPVLQRLLGRCSRHRGFAFESELLIEAARDRVAICAVAIPALYNLEAMRASHFRPIRDLLQIVLMVGGKLLGWGLYPMGLVRIFTSHVASRKRFEIAPKPSRRLSR